VNTTQSIADVPTPPARVLFVNSDADLRAVVTRVLEREAYRVDAVAHSGHALLLCRTTQFDAVVAELSGPDMSGPTLVEQLRRHCPGLSAVYLANPGTPEGVENMLVRPFTRDDLMATLQMALTAVAA
jgi:CheY-like chemotaxis protein